MNWIKKTKVFFWGGAGNRARAILQISTNLQARGFYKTAKALRVFLHRYGLYVSHQAKIGKRFRLPHPTGIVIGAGVVIDDDVTIFQNVTIGAAKTGDAKKGLYPHIKSGVTIYAGAVVIGKVRIGSNAIIGANSVAIRDVPDGSTCVGAPGKMLEAGK